MYTGVCKHRAATVCSYQGNTAVVTFLKNTAVGRARSEPGGTRWCTGGEVKGKLVNGVGSQYSHAISECGVSSITQADAHTSAASCRLNWHPHRFKWTRPFRGKTKSGFYACAITFHTSYNTTTLQGIWSHRDLHSLCIFTTKLPAPSLSQKVFNIRCEIWVCKKVIQSCSTRMVLEGRKAFLNFEYSCSQQMWIFQCGTPVVAVCM